jgi:hypothetical protein
MNVGVTNMPDVPERFWNLMFDAAQRRTGVSVRQSADEQKETGRTVKTVVDVEFEHVPDGLRKRFKEAEKAIRKWM